MFRALKPVAVVIGGVLSVLLVLGTLMGVAGWFVVRQCADRLHECYLATRIPNDLTRGRLGALSQFAVSATTVIFPVVLGENDRGLLVFDRATGGTKLIQEQGFGFASPRLSADGQFLMLIRYAASGGSGDIISCVVSTWRCAVLVRTDYALRSPVYIEGGGIVYAASRGHVVDNRVRFSDWDLYYLKPGSDPVRMSEFRFLDLYSVNVVGDNIIFSAFDVKPNNPVISKNNTISPNWSKIYSVKFDPNAGQIEKLSTPLTPLFLVGGFSNMVSLSPDGRWAAVQNTEAGRFKYRYDLVLARQDGSVDRRIILTGLGFSPGAFVGDTLIFSEMFEDRYDLRLFDLTAGSFRTIAAIDHAPQKLRALQHIDLKIAGEQYAVRTMK